MYKIPRRGDGGGGGETLCGLSLADTGGPHQLPTGKSVTPVDHPQIWRTN